MDLSFIQCIVTHLSQEKQIKALFEGERDEIQHLHHQDAFHTLQLKGWGCAPETNMGSMGGDVLGATPRADGEQRSR